MRNKFDAPIPNDEYENFVNDHLEGAYQLKKGLTQESHERPKRLEKMCRHKNRFPIQ